MMSSAIVMRACQVNFRIAAATIGTIGRADCAPDAAKGTVVIPATNRRTTTARMIRTLGSVCGGEETDCRLRDGLRLMAFSFFIRQFCSGLKTELLSL